MLLDAYKENVSGRNSRAKCLQEGQTRRGLKKVRSTWKSFITTARAVWADQWDWKPYCIRQNERGNSGCILYEDSELHLHLSSYLVGRKNIKARKSQIPEY